MAKTLTDLTAAEILALAIQSEEEDGRIYADLAERVRKDYPDTAKALTAMHKSAMPRKARAGESSTTAGQSR